MAVLLPRFKVSYVALKRRQDINHHIDEILSRKEATDIVEAASDAEAVAAVRDEVLASIEAETQNVSGHAIQPAEFTLVSVKELA